MMSERLQVSHVINQIQAGINCLKGWRQAIITVWYADKNIMICEHYAVLVVKNPQQDTIFHMKEVRSQNILVRFVARLIPICELCVVLLAQIHLQDIIFLQGKILTVGTPLNFIWKELIHYEK